MRTSRAMNESFIFFNSHVIFDKKHELKIAEIFVQKWNIKAMKLMSALKISPKKLFCQSGA